MARPRKNAAKAQSSLLTVDGVQEDVIPMEEQPYPLPEGWKWIRLGSVADIIMGQSPSGSDTTDDASFMPLIGGASDMGARYPDAKKYTKKPTKISTECDIIICIRATLGKPIFSDGEYCLGRGVAAIRSASINRLFMRFFLINFEQYLYDNATGSTFSQISSNTLTQMPIPLPPFEEQKRIVDRIESLFAKLDEAREKAEVVLDGFESRKAAILHKAFTGELTAKWREKKNISLESWGSCPLISVLKEKPRNGYSPKPVEYKTNVKSMTLSATTSGFFRPEFFKYIDEDISENSYLWLSQGDILIQRANSLEKVGTSAIYTGGDHEFIYPDLIMKLQVRAPHSYKYIAHILSTQPTLNYFRAKATGTAGNMPKINQQIVSNTPIVLPSCEEQNEITRILDSLLAKEQQVKEAAETVLEQITLMKKAILARVFRGELTGQVHN